MQVLCAGRTVQVMVCKKQFNIDPARLKDFRGMGVDDHSFLRLEVAGCHDAFFPSDLDFDDAEPAVCRAFQSFMITKVRDIDVIVSRDIYDIRIGIAPYDFIVECYLHFLGMFRGCHSFL